jgi:ATP-dependent Clp protease ATP-binding subunit ClpB
MTEANEHEIFERTRTEVFDLLKKSVRPEFLNRIDDIIMFRPLSKKDVRKIVDIQFRQIQRRLEESGIKLEASSKVLDFIARIGFDPQFGARPLKRVFQREVLNELSKEILAGHLDRNGIVGIDLGSDDKIEFINLDQVHI